MATATRPVDAGGSGDLVDIDDVPLEPTSSTEH